jgi:hypothetical protein
VGCPALTKFDDNLGQRMLARGGNRALFACRRRAAGKYGRFLLRVNLGAQRPQRTTPPASVGCPAGFGGTGPNAVPLACCIRRKKPPQGDATKMLESKPPQRFLTIPDLAIRNRQSSRRSSRRSNAGDTSKYGKGRNLLATNLRATCLLRSGASRPRALYQSHTRNPRHEVPIHLPCCGCIAPYARFLPILPVQPLDSIDLASLGKDSGSAYRGSNPCLPVSSPYKPERP